jgi:hypothetical protein
VAAGCRMEDCKHKELEMLGIVQQVENLEGIYEN